MEALAGKLRNALASGEPLALVDPAWPTEWKEELAVIAAAYFSQERSGILIPTSGTTGLPKYCIHTADTLLCAAKGYAKRFGTKGIIHAVNVLPEHHVGGLMPFLRSAECSGCVHSADYRDPSTIRSAPFPLGKASLSVVPTQLRRMMSERTCLEALREFALIFVGGAACPPDLLERSRSAGLRLCPCYGSTETAAMVTALDPEEFLAGASGVGTPMPHAEVEIDPDQRVLLRSDSLTLGYLPKQVGFKREPFTTGDLGTIDAKGHLHILGRTDRVIITGGEKVHPEQVEAAALATGLVQGARCFGMVDPDWGMRVELSVVPIRPENNLPDKLMEKMKTRLPSYALPKEIRFARDNELPEKLK